MNVNKTYVAIGVVIALICIYLLFFTNGSTPPTTSVRSVVLICYPGNTKCATVKHHWNEAVKRIAADPRGKSIYLRIEEPTELSYEDAPRTEYAINIILKDATSLQHNLTLDSMADVDALVKAVLSTYETT